MQIWVDIDSCPGEIKNILTSAVKCAEVSLTFITKRGHEPFQDSNISLVELSRESYAIANREIASRSKVGDLVITDDIDLATEVMEKDVIALGFKGETYSSEEVEQMKKMAEFIETMRSAGAEIGSQPPLTYSEKKIFADKLDSILMRC